MDGDLRPLAVMGAGTGNRVATTSGGGTDDPPVATDDDDPMLAPPPLPVALATVSESA